jgi:hypothetical protein
MNKIMTFEVILVALNCIVWLGPLCIALTRRTISLIHPSSIFPLFVTVSILVSMTEHWFGWSGRAFIHGLRITTRTYYLQHDFFLIPLFIVLLAGLVYHYGVYRGCGRVVSKNIDRIHLTGHLKSVPPKYTIQLFFIGVIFFLMCTVPFVLFGQGRGFFWAAALVYAFVFIPVLLYNQRNGMGLLFLFLGFLIVGIRVSKGDYIYYLLPLILFNQESLFLKLFKKEFFMNKIKIIKSLLLATAIIVVIFGTFKMAELRGESLEGISLPQRIISREYGFEVFSILVDKNDPMGNISNGSWLLLEFIEAIPSVLGIEKVQIGHEVARVFLPKDYAVLPEAGFHRFFLFSFYHDFGWIGAILGSCLLGFVFGRLYKLALNKTYKKKVLWPLIIYLPIPVYSELIVNGAIAYVLIHIVFGSLIVWMIARLSTVDMV